MKGRTPRRRRAPLRRRKTALEIANSARRRGEAALGESERRYHDLVENSLGLICAHDLDGHLLFVNPAAARSLGYESKDGIGKNLRDFLAPDTRHLFDDYLRRIRENGIDDGLMKLVTSQGRERVWMYRNVRRDDSGKPSYVVGHALDVTDRVMIERAFRTNQEASHRALRELEARVEERTAELQLLNNRLRAEIMKRTRAEEMREFVQRHERDTLAFLATASDRLTHVLDYETTLVTLERLPVPFMADCTILCVLNDDGTCRSIRGHHATVEGQSALEQLASSAPRHLSADTLVARVTAARRAELITHAPDEFASRFLGSGPHVEHLQKLVFGDVIIVPLVVDDRVLGALSLISNAPGRYTRSELAVIEDLIRRFQVAIEQVRLHREVREANRLKDEFLASVSHELRTPLNGILGWSRILRTHRLDPATDRAVEIIERNADLQIRLIEDILDVSRIVTGKLTLEVQPVTVGVVAASALDSIRPAAQAKGIRIVEEIDSAATMLGDARRLQQVIWNILSNAVKFTGAGGRVDVTLRRVDGTVELTVTDTGIGIPREVLPFVFDRFRHGDASTARSYGGLGLGLAIVRHLVELHGGAVSVESTEREGTAVIVNFPADTGASVAAARESTMSNAALPTAPLTLLRNRSVLVIDDNADSCELVAAIVQGSGASVRTAGSAAEAFDAVTQSVPDVLISAVALAGEDGYDLMRRIRGLLPEEGGNVLAVALSESVRAEDKTRALAAGFQCHVAKPVKPQTLLRLVAGLLESRSYT